MTKTLTRALLLVSLIIACNRSQEASSDTVAGDVLLAEADTVGFHALDEALTQEKFRRYVVAQRALEAVEEPRELPRINLRNPRRSEVDSTVLVLETRPATREAIENSGLSVRDFVLTSVALAQALNFPEDARNLVPSRNVAFVDQNRDEVKRVGAFRRFRIVADDDDGRGRGRGHDKQRGSKGRGHGRGHNKR